MDTRTQIAALLKQLSEGVFEKQHIIAMALLSAIAGESIFLLGPSGTAKSLVARRLKLAFKGGKAFEYLMSRFSTPDEIFGPVSISLLKNEDRYERVTEGFLPTAHIVFLDEIWKASPSIQNALLTAINERIFQNGNKTLFLPMKTLIAASNELPAEEEGLEALWDRFLVRMVSNCIQSETEFFKMIRKKAAAEIAIPDNLQITDVQYNEWQQEIEAVQIADEICTSVSHIRKRLKEKAKEEGVNVMNYYVSDRRWKKCFHLLQTSAFLNGRKAIDMTDLPLLIHCLWNKSETIPFVIDIVCTSLTAHIDRQLDKLEKDIEKAMKEKNKTRTGQSSNGPFSVLNYFYYTILNYPKGRCLFYVADYDHIANYETGDTTNGIIYPDKDKNAWIVRALHTGAPFAYITRANANVKKVSLKKCSGGIIIDGIPYGFEKISGSGTNLFDGYDNAATIALDALASNVQPQMQKLKDLFSGATHLFLSDDDLKITKKQFALCEKRIEEIKAKAKNAQQLL